MGVCYVAGQGVRKSEVEAVSLSIIWVWNDVDAG